MTAEENRIFIARLNQSEDSWTERKRSFADREVRQTVVGFANTVADGQIGVMFIGADNQGQHEGVLDADDVQKKIAGALEHCYPPIDFKLGVLSTEAQGRSIEIVTIIVPFSRNRPHFTGAAFVRRGSETIKASSELFRELVASQNDKTRRILQFKHKKVGLRFRSKSGFWYDLESRVDSCDAHSVRLHDFEMRLWIFPISEIEISATLNNELEIIAGPPGTEDQHIAEMVRRWARFRHPPLAGDFHLPTDWLVEQILANPSIARNGVAAVADSSNEFWPRALLLHVRMAARGIENPLSRPQKIKRLRNKFHQHGQFTPSATNLIGAAVGATAEVATSWKEAEEFLKVLCQDSAALKKIPFDTLQNALLSHLNF